MAVVEGKARDIVGVQTDHLIKTGVKGTLGEAELEVSRTVIQGRMLYAAREVDPANAQQGGDRPKVRVEDDQATQPRALTDADALQDDGVVNDRTLGIGARSDQDGVRAGVDGRLHGREGVRDDDGAGVDRVESDTRAKNQGDAAQELAGQ